jgi:Xaa-Pro aminopeptidase
VIDAKTEALSELRAGVPASAIYHAVRRVFDDARLPVHIDMVGHGIGLDTHEPPMLSPINNEPLKENMVVNIEPWVTLPDDQGVLVIEDTFLVTADGHDELTLPHAAELWVVDR